MLLHLLAVVEAQQEAARLLEMAVLAVAVLALVQLLVEQEIHLQLHHLKEIMVEQVLEKLAVAAAVEHLLLGKQVTQALQIKAVMAALARHLA
jgi:hypothetical protein